MSDEIKEILEYYRKYMSIKDCIKLSKIEDYITNLQNENEDYKSRIEKAIHLIRHNDIYDYRVFEEMLLNILQGAGND